MLERLNQFWDLNFGGNQKKGESPIENIRKFASFMYFVEYFSNYQSKMSISVTFSLCIKWSSSEKWS